ncbi:MAG: hypothetical protein CMI63_02150 [Parvularcula sp.]|uniref:hypothetical protein n=1 Tax=Hyphococcus sp. TaxID=2038636 RepID=UPI000C5EFEA3|nr:hypothetical protein [Parvularcula sp.]
MEDNDLPDFDADDLLEAMAEVLRKEELEKLNLSSAEAAPEEDEDASTVPGDSFDAPAGELVEGQALECEEECAG